MLTNHFKIALRGFRRHKLFTLINVIGLSIGISAALVIYLIVQHDFSFDKFHPDGQRIYRVVANYSYSGSPGYNPGIPGPMMIAAETQISGLQDIAPLLRLSRPDVTVPGHQSAPSKFRLQNKIALVGEGYFGIFPYRWLAGSATTSLSEPFQVVLTSEQANKYFPGISFDQMIGRTVVYDSIETTVKGIVKTPEQNTDFSFHDFISFPTAFAVAGLKARLRLNNWGGSSPLLQIFIKLAPNATAPGTAHQFNDLLKKNLTPHTGNTLTLALQPLADIHFNPNYGTFDGGRVADKTTLYQLSAIGLFLLLLGCINFVNLATAQSSQRAREIGIRKTLGSGRKQLMIQFLVETFLLTLTAITISVAMTPGILKGFSSFVPEGVSIDFVRQPNIILFLLILSVAVSVSSGIYPALILSGYRPALILKNQVQPASRQSRNAWLRKSLTVTQFVIAQFFITATIFVSKQIYFALHKDLGFKKTAVVIVNAPEKHRQGTLKKLYTDKLRSIAQVDMVSLGYDAPISDLTNSTDGAYRDGKKEIKMEGLAEKFGDENYIKLYHIPLLAGRNLRPDDTTNVVMVNNTLVKTIGLKDPNEAIGKDIVDFNGDTRMRIIGVVADFQQESIHSAIAPLVILTSRDPGFNSTFHIALKPRTAGGNDWKMAIAGMENAWKEVYPNDDFGYHFLDENIASLYSSEQNTATLLRWATGLSILISCLGLLGLAIYTSAQRTKEIGVRKVLGATVPQIVALLSGELLWLVLLSFLIVSPVAWWVMNKWMQGFADRTAIDWWVFALSGAGMFLATIATSASQTIRAAMTNPVKSLRNQ
jgi:ABC-type antimicrobial peptide transport system permease subunit